MKHLFLFLLLFSAYLLADPLSENNEKRLQEIVGLFKSDSNEEALRQLKLYEAVLLEAINDSKDAGAYALLGQAYFYAGMDSSAIDAFNNALQLDPSLSNAHFFIGLIHVYAGDLNKAERSFRDAIILNSNNEDYFVELGRILQMKNDSRSASIEYENALAIDETNFRANFNLANIYANEGNNEEAEERYLAALKKQPDDPDSNYNLGQLYQNINRHQSAIKYFSKVVDRDATEWRAIAKIIQENQALGNIEARDIAIRDMHDLWREGAVSDLQDQGFFVREQTQIDTGKLFVLEYFELKGELARKFVFKLQDVVTGDNKFDVSLGSYDESTQLSRELGDIGADDRVFHLDGYAPNGSHYTYAFFRSLPDYEVVREMALNALSGELKAISSTVPSKATDPQEENQ